MKGFVAALQISTSILPNSLLVSFTRFISSSSCAILPAIGKANSDPIFLFISSAVSLHASIFLLEIITLAP